MSELFQIKKNRANQKNMTGIESDNGEVLTNNYDMIEYVSNFYEDLYADQHIDSVMGAYFLANKDKLSVEERTLCEGEFTVDVLKSAIKRTKSNSSPGIDGLAIEFYKTFSEKISSYLVKVFNSILLEGKLGKMQNCAIIVLICKKIEEAKKLKNWRSFSLLCNDLKLISKILSIRLSLVMEKLVGSFQTSGFFNNIHLIRNITDYVIQKDKSVTNIIG